MARTLFRRIAVATGTGLAAGAGLAFGHRAMKPRIGDSAPASLELLIEQLDRMEARVALAEKRPAAEPSEAAVHVSIARIDDLIAAQAREIELLRIRADEAGTIAAAEIRLTERRFKEAAAALLAEIEAVLTPRVEDLRQRLQLEMKESVAAALAGFEQAIDTRISSRMSALERQLFDLSASLADLKHHAGETDSNLQKLIEAVERLCDRQDPDLLQRPSLQEVPTPEPAGVDLPFERHLKEALADTPAAVVVISEAARSERA